VTTNVAVGVGDSAKKIASNVNAQTSSSGVSATAATQATIAGIADGSVQFTLRGSNSLANNANSQAVTISSSVVGGDLSSLAQAVNAQSNTTGVTASIKLTAAGAKELQLNNSSGDDISIASTASDTSLTAATLRGADTVPAIGATAATNGTGVTIAATGVTVGGQVSYSSDSGFSITAADASVLGTTATVGSQLQKVSDIDVSSIAGANKALLTIDSALTSINSNRAALGAIQNRFASTISNLQTTTENLSASRSRIQDTDFASETANLTRGQILQQAGTAILAQANSLPNGVLALLRG
jgi:flagellin